MGILREMLRHRFVAYDVGDRHPATPLQHSVHFSEEVLLVLGANQIDHAIGNDYVDGFVGDQWLLLANSFCAIIQAREIRTERTGFYSRYLSRSFRSVFSC